ncbi:hypothetical protein OMAG_002245 [Candidatus Omnitrophus magneticus]|uniref:Uncharacterized protein n=1 Tax=Candidatus Omnitrophus magneticus TaxID=1609969 RepID=A0A0F0CKW7_9BACT|nr:hypothetical protein OMAG_002245 [Candidatus Omnitrophus magneticus]
MPSFGARLGEFLTVIHVDLSTAIFVYLFFSVIAVLVLWMLLHFGTNVKFFKSEEKYIWHCDICGKTYVDSKNTVISQCPRCKSYIERKRDIDFKRRQKS